MDPKRGAQKDAKTEHVGFWKSWGAQDGTKTFRVGACGLQDPSWGRLGASFGRPGAVLGAPGPPKSLFSCPPGLENTTKTYVFFKDFQFRFKKSCFLIFSSPAGSRIIRKTEFFKLLEPRRDRQKRKN